MPPRRYTPRVIPAIPAGSWRAAGNRFTPRRINEPVPIERYSRKLEGIRLTGGQVQGLIPGWAAATGTVASPGAHTSIAATAPVAVSGIYTINWTVTLSGTVGAGDANNFQLFVGPSLVATSVNAGAAGTYVQAPVSVFVASGLTVAVANNAAGTAGSTYGASIPAPGGSLTLTVGPQGLGTVWYPTQATLSTTTGALDTSTALVYLGIGGVPTQLVATIYSGNGTVGVALPPMTPGEFLITSWTNAHPGDTASVNILGTMDALTTG